MAANDSELAGEQQVVDRLYRRLDELRAQSRQRLAAVRRAGPSGSPQNRSERDAFATLYEDRVAQLESVEDRLAFGRLDLHDGERRYVGRIGLTDEEQSPLLTDWRAPAAQAFYRATAAHPDGVVRRRHLVTSGRQVTSLEDDVLDLDALVRSGVDPRSLAGVSGEGALLAALGAARTGRMGDIVATIQAEQDAIIRSELTGALVVQGGPGTGKTAVALHRAAYLLYAHRRVLERSGVLMVGPSRTFLRYIDQVLPSLGETGVVTATVADLFPGVAARGTEPAEVAELKGRTVMATVVRRAVRQRQRVPQQPTSVRVDGRTVVVRPRDVADAIARARRQNRPHNQARVTFVRDMLARLAEQYVQQLGWDVAPEDRAEIVEDLRTTREIRIALNLAWMPLTPQGLLTDLWTRPHRLAAAAPELSPRERALLARPADAAWTPADVPLLDEAAELLGEDDQAARAQARADAERHAAEIEYARQVLRSTGAGDLVSAEALAGRFATSGPSLTTAERAAADRTWTYGHVVVDEAQELSAMAWRALLRRVPTRSLTIVGDVAQTSSPGGTRDWAAMLDPLLRGSWRLAELTVNYRTPAVVAQAAGRVAEAAGLPVSPQTSARDVPDALTSERVAAEDDLATAAAAAARRRAAEVAEVSGAGRVAVVAVAGRTSAVRAALAAAGVEAPEGEAVDLHAPLVVLTPAQSKGLEFDVVVLVEPAEVLAASPGDLYVAMTRPTHALHVVHLRDLPGRFDEPS
ncbi:UvrD/REP helicase [Cellulomonas flavigena DSM 20109]|uniref:UvrD/REP helicase n=1 Tax=Cellulomonas flavigena (strain ATCC 482 / DSM 20109 / BCRC 11376 / JCM 18109 / NBRC 3775 / NCIMB 8073 / NRS 134) TaxID=446466 RepID=D5UDR5_CELFN|nr:AAA family ATPase [Cellulomonas flavigena]ADG74473.1 UvrD/REP helicase [Cellulomonas flavigena DSM 20109]